MSVLDLAERCEQATEPYRELEEAIALALGWSPIPNPTNAGGLVGRWTQPNGEMSGMEGPPLYTRSLDAALTLVPEGFAWVVYWDGYAGVEKITADDLPQVDQQSASPALALCAAALRARAAQQ